MRVDHVRKIPVCGKSPSKTLQLIKTITDSPDSELSTASLFLNLRPSTRARSIAQQSRRSQ